MPDRRSPASTSSGSRLSPGILEPFLMPGQKVDYMNIGVGGHDVDAPGSYDFDRFAPTVIPIEADSLDLHDPSSNPTFLLLTSQGYRLVSHAIITSIYMLRRPIRAGAGLAGTACANSRPPSIVLHGASCVEAAGAAHRSVTHRGPIALREVQACGALAGAVSSPGALGPTP